MKLSKIKTDKSDSKLICEYAKQVELKLWQGNSKASNRMSSNDQTPFCIYKTKHYAKKQITW